MSSIIVDRPASRFPQPTPVPLFLRDSFLFLSFGLVFVCVCVCSLSWRPETPPEAATVSSLRVCVLAQILFFSNNVLKSFLPCFSTRLGDTTEARDNTESIV